MLFDAAVMRGGKVSCWLDLSVLLCFPPPQRFSIGQRGSPAQGEVCMFVWPPAPCCHFLPNHWCGLTQLPVFSKVDAGSRPLSIPTLLLFLAPAAV